VEYSSVIIPSKIGLYRNEFHNHVNSNIIVRVGTLCVVNTIEDGFARLFSRNKITQNYSIIINVFERITVKKRIIYTYLIFIS